jgi:hypothetical protein
VIESEEIAALRSRLLAAEQRAAQAEPLTDEERQRLTKHFTAYCKCELCAWMRRAVPTEPGGGDEP